MASPLGPDKVVVREEPEKARQCLDGEYFPHPAALAGIDPWSASVDEWARSDVPSPLVRNEQGVARRRLAGEYFPQSAAQVAVVQWSAPVSERVDGVEAPNPPFVPQEPELRCGRVQVGGQGPAEEYFPRPAEFTLKTGRRSKFLRGGKFLGIFPDPLEGGGVDKDRAETGKGGGGGPRGGRVAPLGRAAGTPQPQPPKGPPRAVRGTPPEHPIPHTTTPLEVRGEGWLPQNLGSPGWAWAGLEGGAGGSSEPAGLGGVGRKQLRARGPTGGCDKVG